MPFQRNAPLPSVEDRPSEIRPHYCGRFPACDSRGSTQRMPLLTARSGSDVLADGAARGLVASAAGNPTRCDAGAATGFGAASA